MRGAKNMSAKNEFDGKKPLTKSQARNAKFGSVFIVNDRDVFNHKGPQKARRVVLVGKKNGSLVVAPVRKTLSVSIEVSGFDGGRSVMLYKAVVVSKNKVYSKNGFRNTKNDYLTTNEKIKLKKALRKK